MNETTSGGEGQASPEPSEHTGIFKEELIETLEKIDIPKLLEEGSIARIEDAVAIINLCTHVLSGTYQTAEDLRQNIVALNAVEESARQHGAFGYQEALATQTQAPSREFIDTLRSLPANVYKARAYTHLYTLSINTQDRVDKLETLVAASQASNDRLLEVLQPGEAMAPTDQRLAQLLEYSVRGLLAYYRDQGLYAQTPESKEHYIANLQEQARRPLHITISPSIDPATLPFKTADLTDPGTLFPLPPALLAGISNVTIVSAQEATNSDAFGQGLDATYHHGKREIGMSLIFSERMRQNQNGRYEAGQFMFTNAADAYKNLFRHELGHHLHSFNFTVDEMESVYQAWMTDYNQNNQRHMSGYVAACAERNAYPAMEAVAVSMELMHNSPGLFTIVAPNMSKALTDIIVSRLPQADQELWRLQIADRAELELITVTVGGATIEQLRANYFHRQQELFASYLSGPQPGDTVAEPKQQ